MSNPIEDRVEAIVLSLLEEQADSSIELVDVEYVKEHDWYLRVFIDKKGGIEIDDCQALSEALEEKLDAEDFIKDSYILEVSSPGIDRVLRKPRDFVREQGKKVDVRFFAPLDGKKELTGVLTGCDAEKHTITVDAAVLPLDKISQVRLHIDF